MASISSSDILCSFASSALSTPIAISVDCSSMAVITPQFSESKPYFPLSYPISRTVSLTIFWISTYPLVVISPITSTRPVVIAVSQATRLIGSCSISASRTASEIWSQILSGWPSVTDSEVNKRFSILILLFFWGLPLGAFLPGLSFKIMSYRIFFPTYNLKMSPPKADSILRYIKSPYCSITRSGRHLPYPGLP